MFTANAMFTTLSRTTSTTYTLISGWPHYNHISEGLFLGMIPIKSSWVRVSDMHTEIIDFVKKTNPARPLKLVVSVTEKDELEGSGIWFARTVQTDDWRKKGVAHHLLQMKDLTADVSNQLAMETVFLIRDTIERGHSVYIHCKAGKSRSIFILSLYLTTYGLDPNNPIPMPLDKVIKHLGDNRPQMYFDKPKEKKALEIINEMQEMQKRQSELHSVVPKFNLKILNIIDQYLFAKENIAAPSAVLEDMNKVPEIPQPPSNLRP